VTTTAIVTITNTFHDTEARMLSRSGRLTQRQLDRAARKLCRSNDCQCGNMERATADGRRVDLEPDGLFGAVVRKGRA